VSFSPNGLNTFIVNGSSGGGSGPDPTATMTIVTANYIPGEVPAGAVNGVNKNFSTASDFNDLIVYLNGVRQKSGGEDYTVTGAKTFQFTLAPLTGDVILCAYFTIP